MKIKVIALLMAVFVIAIGCTRSPSSSTEAAADEPYTITVGGSTSVNPLMELFVDEYSKVKPHIKVDIQPTGSGDGITNAGGTYQIGMSSRELTPTEQGRGLKENVVAIDGIAVIVNSGSAVSSLTVEQIHGIYTGTITNWNQVGGRNAAIAVISREEGSGTRGAFEELVGFQGRLLANANQLTSTGAILANVAQNSDAIGYISLGSVNDTIKAIAVDGIAPTTENVLNSSYKIARRFILLTGNNIHPESSAFIDWMLSPDGQRIVSRSWISVR
ncbi:MAG: phosphate ABC transporter substrate-binding protein [Treponema sp.]|nr:phosphate ABC transporter substrate-binding protein [Treponema sp.]